jgi:phospholipid/cholesterol/gamma-HCH transport system permease protein
VAARVSLRRQPKPTFGQAQSTLGETRSTFAEMIVIAGATVALLLKALIALCTPPFTWRDEFMREYVSVLRRCLPTVVLVQFTFGISVGVIVLNFSDTVGSLDRSGIAIPNVMFRDFGPFMTAAVLAGVVGTAITADLGARKIRDELDAIQVLGIDPVRHLVAPRVLTLLVATVPLLVVTVVVAGLGTYVPQITYFHDTGSTFVHELPAYLSALDVYGSLIRLPFFALIIGSICCYKGMHVGGGAEGVGRAVNQAVVSCLLMIFFVNAVFTQIFLALFPNATVFP